MEIRADADAPVRIFVANLLIYEAIRGIIK